MVIGQIFVLTCMDRGQSLCSDLHGQRPESLF
jgi:hypothetical protein